MVVMVMTMTMMEITTPMSTDAGLDPAGWAATEMHKASAIVGLDPVTSTVTGPDGERCGNKSMGLDPTGGTVQEGGEEGATPRGRRGAPSSFKLARGRDRSGGSRAALVQRARQSRLWLARQAKDSRLRGACACCRSERQEGRDDLSLRSQRSGPRARLYRRSVGPSTREVAVVAARGGAPTLGAVRLAAARAAPQTVWKRTLAEPTDIAACAAPLAVAVAAAQLVARTKRASGTDCAEDRCGARSRRRNRTNCECEAAPHRCRRR